ncbi:MAG: ribosome small subunit-dependent GTPase A [Chitinophagaceae bacterium]|nr:MAG: ribosome small subunit-dependent GTPase A [Chitinophagaceae bacterium]
MKALVIRSTGSWYTVISHDNQKIECRLKGKLRLKGYHSTNPVVVGDMVTLEKSESADYVIKEVYDRKNQMVRLSPRHKHMKHVIAANIDMAILLVTISKPRTSTGFIDRYLVVAEEFSVPVTIVFNKIDLLKEKEHKKLDEIIERYSNCGYPCLKTSAAKNTGIDEVKKIIKGKICLISGYSGVGKSTIINAIYPELNIKTAEISKQTGKGKHTTTYAEMHQMPFGGYLIDTPGTKEFALPEIDPRTLSHHFPEMVPYLQYCKFNNCNHVNEPDCAVKDAVSDGQIDFNRYESYLSMLSELQLKNLY